MERPVVPNRQEETEDGMEIDMPKDADADGTEEANGTELEDPKDDNSSSSSDSEEEAQPASSLSGECQIAQVNLACLRFFACGKDWMERERRMRAA